MDFSFPEKGLSGVQSFSIVKSNVENFFETKSIFFQTLNLWVILCLFFQMSNTFQIFFNLKILIQVILHEYILPSTLYDKHELPIPYNFEAISICSRKLIGNYI